MKKKIICTFLASLLAFGCPVSAFAAEITATAIPNSKNLEGWSDFSDGMCLIIQNRSKLGYINTAGKVVISPKYAYARDFSEGKAMVVIDGKVCYINKTGNVVISTGLNYDYDEYGWAYSCETEFKNGMACVYGPGGWGSINTAGKVVIPFQFDKPYFFNEKGLAQVFLNGDMNYIDTKGNLIFPAGYSSIGENKNGTWTGVRHDQLSHAGFLHSEYSSYDLLDAKGNIIKTNVKTSAGKNFDMIALAQATLDDYGLSKDRYLSISTPVDGIAKASLLYDVAVANYGGARNVYIDTKTCREIAGPFNLAEDFREGYALVSKNVTDGFVTYTKNGLINTKGQPVLPLEYETVNTKGLSEGHMLAKKNGTLYLIKSTGHKGGFTDVSSADYFYKPVKWAVEKGITSGVSDSSFAPNQTCTRGQIISFLWRAAGSPQPSISNPYSDVKSNDYFYKAALWAYEQGMAEDIAFSPNAPCTRAMAVEFMWRYDGSPSYTAELPFYDVNNDANYAEAIAWAVDEGVTSGTSETTFSPDSTCTRGQIVTFLYRGFAG